MLLPPTILAARPVLAGATHNFTIDGMLIVDTFDFQQLRHFTALETGAALLPLTVVATVTSALIGGRFTHRYGPRAGIVSGMASCAVAWPSPPSARTWSPRRRRWQ